MHASLLLLSALGAAVLAAPTYPEIKGEAATPRGLEDLSDYFNMLANKVQLSKSLAAVPVCDLSKAQQPISPTPLQPPTAGYVLKHVAIGRGTQNYTCDTTNATAIPVATGAVATLFNASCIASTYPDLLNMLPKVALAFDLPDGESPRMQPSNLVISGHHFFTNATTPFFDLGEVGQAPCAKYSAVPAPADAPRGLNGEAAVPWLKLVTRVGATGKLQEVYRLETAGGSAPATCAGMPASFEVQYSSQYWFYQS